MRLDRDLAEPAPVPKQGIERAVKIIESGQLTRYGEFKGSGSEVALLEQAFADYMGTRYAVAVNSGGSAIFLALLCSGVRPGDQVLLNAFTLAPVPGAIAHAGAEPLFVECTDNYTIDLDDLVTKANSGARVLLLSHMRGHIADMDQVLAICKRHNITVIEDCAHTLGARWDGELSGSFGAFGCFSLQAYKHINAGEGGILVTDDEDAAAKAILHSGSYMLYAQHTAAPPLSVFERHKLTTPNYSLRMQEVTAALARPQIELLEERAVQWNERYHWLATGLGQLPYVRLPTRDIREAFVGSSIQFSFEDLSSDRINRVVQHCNDHGVALKWFGRRDPQGFTSSPEHWQFTEASRSLKQTPHGLRGLCDMRIPLTLTHEEAELICRIVLEALEITE